LRRWIEKLPLSVKNDLLFRLAQGTDPHVAAELVQQYNQSRVGPRRSVEEGPNRRTVGQLLAAVDGWSRRPDGTGRGR
jgi:hypothetical protein